MEGCENRRSYLFRSSVLGRKCVHKSRATESMIWLANLVHAKRFWVLVVLLDEVGLKLTVASESVLTKSLGHLTRIMESG